MRKQGFHRKFNFPDADLYAMVVERLKHAQRDFKEFKDFGMTMTKLKGIQSRVLQFYNLPNDDELVGIQMVVTDKKYDKANLLKSAIRAIMTRVAIKYGQRSGRYRTYGTAKMSDMTDAQLLFCGRRVARVGRKQLALLAETGLNENALMRVQKAANDFEKSMNIQQDKVADRDIAVEKRVILANKIYDDLIQLSDIGKSIWDNQNKTYYEQYAIYESNNDQKKKRKKASSSKDAT